MAALLAQLVNIVDVATGEAIEHLVKCHSAEQAARAVAAANATVPSLGAVRIQQPALVTVEEPRPQGRPCYDATIEAAVAALGSALNGRTVAARARQIVRHIAATATDAALIPKRRTAEIFLTRGKKRGKRRGKRAHAKIRRRRQSC